MPDEQEAFPRLTGVPSQLTDWADDVADWNENHRPVSGDNCVLTDAPGKGKAINMTASASGSGLGSYTPFQVITRMKPGTGVNGITPTYQFAVMFGELNMTRTPDNTATIEGVPALEDALDPTAFTWYDWNGAPDVVYIDIVGITVASYPSGESYAINSGSQGGMFDVTQIAWANANAYVSGTTDATIIGVTDQDEACIPLAYLNPGTGAAPIVTQQVTTNLVMAFQWLDGSPAYYPPI